MKTQPEAESDTRTDYQRFEDFAKKLVAVPKKEIDQKQKKYERQKKLQKAKVGR